MYLIKTCPQFFKQRQPHPFLTKVLAANHLKLNRIYHHPFNTNLFKGTLSSSLFGHYLRDDFYYLNQFSVVLKTLADRAKEIDPDLSHHLSHLGQDIVDSELDMQLKYKEHISTQTIHVPGSSISIYSESLIKTASNAQLAVGLSSILPCFWIYHELGTQHRELSPNNPYQDWINTYSSPEFIRATQKLAQVLGTLHAQASPDLTAAMEQAFAQSTGFELDFFDEVYAKQCPAHPEGVSLHENITPREYDRI